MTKTAGTIAGALVALAMANSALAQQQPGQLGSGPPEDFYIEAARSADGTIALSQTEIHLASGGYYRLNFVCPEGTENEAGVAFSAPEFLENTHIRIVSVGDTRSEGQQIPEINFHLQGLNVRMFECEGLALTARISFHPMRAGTYPFTVSNDTTDPAQEITGQFVVD